jgi:hypothetical protein
MITKKSAIATFTNTTSSIINLANSDVVTGIIIPNDAAFNSKTLDVLISFDGTNFFTWYDYEGNKFTVTTGAARFVPIDFNTLLAIKAIKFEASASVDGKYIEVTYADVQ